MLSPPCIVSISAQWSRKSELPYKCVQARFRLRFSHRLLFSRMSPHLPANNCKEGSGSFIAVFSGCPAVPTSFFVTASPTTGRPSDVTLDWYREIFKRFSDTKGLHSSRCTAQSCTGSQADHESFIELFDAHLRDTEFRIHVVARREPSYLSGRWRLRAVWTPAVSSAGTAVTKLMESDPICPP